jgi:PAS domain S-box-containing protein
LPPFLGSDGSYRPLLYVTIAAAVALYAIAIVGFARRYRTLTPLELWIVCAAIAIALEALLTLFSPVRFEVGTYVARAFSVFSSCVVFASLGVDALRADRRAWLSRRQASLAEASPQIVLLVARGAVSYVNRPFTETTGLSADAAIGVQWLRALADDRTIEDRRFAHALLAGEAFDGYARIPTLHGPRTFLVRSAPMREGDDPSARETGTWLVTAVDVEEQRRAMEELRALYARERRISTALQNVAVPAVLPQIDGVAFDAVYRAATREGEVGGDWYDVFTVDEGTVAFSIGDTTGHGLEAASAMVRVRETIRAAASSLGAQPREVLAFVNRALCTANDDLLATAIFGVYEPQTRRVSYAVAGHPAPLLREASSVVVLPGGGLTLGVDADAAYTTETFVLDDDAALALYTDGLTENERDLIAGETRLAELFADRGRSARAIVDAVTAAGQYDDVALLVITAVPFARSVPVWRFHSDDPETARTARASFAEYLTRRGYSPDAVGVAELVFGELVGNVVRHAPGPIDIDLAWSDGTPVLRVHDRGAPIVRRAIDLPTDIMSESGRGLFLVRTLAGEPVFAQRPGGGNVVTVRLTEILTALAS